MKPRLTHHVQIAGWDAFADILYRCKIAPRGYSIGDWVGVGGFQLTGTPEASYVDAVQMMLVTHSKSEVIALPNIRPPMSIARSMSSGTELTQSSLPASSLKPKERTPNPLMLQLFISSAPHRCQSLISPLRTKILSVRSQVIHRFQSKLQSILGSPDSTLQVSR